MSNRTRQTALFAVMETVIAQVIKLDRSKCADLIALSGCTFCINITEPSLSVYLVIGPMGYPRLQSVYEGKITTGISGTASDFLALALSEDPGAELINSPLEISGESNKLLEMQVALQKIDIDWEAALTPYLGDIATHHIGTVVRKIHRWTKLVNSSLVRQIQEYIHEEAKISPSKLEVEDFYTDARKLKLALDRLASNVKRLRESS